MRKPDFFLVGGMRCGTTALDQYLGQHPGIYMASPKDPHVFDQDLAWPSRRITWEEYQARFAEADREQRVGDPNSTYLYSTEAAGRIQAFHPAAKIVIMLRNPVDLLYSWHGWMRFHDVEPIEDFADALAAEERRKQGHDLPDTDYAPAVFFYRDLARLSDQVKRYLDCFGAEQVHLIIYDDFRQHLPDIYRTLLEFLDVDPSFRPEFPVVNQNRVPRSRLVNRVLNHPPEPLSRIVKGLLPNPQTREALIRRLRQLNKHYKPRSTVDPKVRSRLLSELSPEIRRLGRLIGRDLSGWLDS
jgi:hypothetical protein